MKTTGSPLIALSGPSGVGKEYTKAVIRAELGHLSEPVVASTRKRRPGEAASRLAGMTEFGFIESVIAGHIVLPHRPFREEGTAWYGFVRDSLEIEAPLLTEVHSTVLDSFRSLTRSMGRDALIVGLVAPDETLITNLTGPGRSGCEDDVTLRLRHARNEVAEIESAAKVGVVDHVFDMSLGSRDQSVGAIVALAKGAV